MRKALFVRFKQIIAQVLMSRVVFRVAFQTSDQVRRRIPEDIQSIVNRDQEIVFGSCELLQVADYSYEYYFDFRAFHATYAAFLKAVDRINQGPSRLCRAGQHHHSCSNIKIHLYSESC